MGVSFSGILRRELRATLLRDHAESFQTFRLMQLSGNGTGATIIAQWHVDLLVLFGMHVRVDPDGSFGLSASWSTTTEVVNEASNPAGFSELRNALVMDVCVIYGFVHTVDAKDSAHAVAAGEKGAAYVRRLYHMQGVRVALDAYKLAQKEKDAPRAPPLETIADAAVKLGEIGASTQMTLSLIAVENTLHKAFEMRKGSSGAKSTRFHMRELLLRTTKDFAAYAVGHFYAALAELMADASDDRFLSVAYEYVPAQRPASSEH
jgi:hypothetical protein